MRWIGRLWSDDPVVEPTPQPETAGTQMGWCSNCDADRPYWVKEGSQSSYGVIPDWVFCCFCGAWWPDFLEDAS